MSPILKRDIGEHVRHTRRLAAAVTGQPADNQKDTSGEEEWLKPPGIYASGSSPRQGMGVIEDEEHRRHTDEWKRTGIALDRKGKGRAREGVNGVGFEGDESDEDGEGEGEGEGERMLKTGIDRGRRKSAGPTSLTFPRERLEYGEVELEPPISTAKEKWVDLRNLLFEATPSLLLSLIGLVFTGELLEHLARWRVFQRVDELFILFPMIGNLKGNLEMCLSARLGTSANIGELDHRVIRRALLEANMILLGLQALLISCLAAVLSFVLGLLTVHRLGDAVGPVGNSTHFPGGSEGMDPELAVGEQEWLEGYTRPGWKQLVMVLATGMGAAGLSSAVLGSFMSSMIVLCQWTGVDPDNVTPPIASCLGDLLTLFILALLGSLLVGTMDSPIPLVAVIMMTVAAAWFTQRVMQNQWVKKVAKGGWVPLIGAMLISSGTGMVLDRGVSKYRGFALLAISMTGLTGSIGAIHANRLSTTLHTNLHPPTSSSRTHLGLSALQRAATLFLIAFPCQGCFIAFVSWARWIDISLGWAGWLTFALTTSVSLFLAQGLTLFFWQKDLDPDSYALPILSALVDFIGQLLLMLAYQICIWEGRDVLVDEALQRQRM